MSVTGIDHIGIAVESLEESIPFYRDRLGLEYLGTEEVADQKVRVAMFAVGGSRIELLEPTSPESPIAKALEKRGPGMHHIAYSVDNAGTQVESLIRMGVRMIDREPRTGAGGALIAFVHPSDSGRVLTELCQHPHGEGESRT